MRFSIDVGGELELKLFQAALLYRNSRGNRHMATVHNVIQSEAGGAPSLGPGQLLSMAALRELTKLLGTGCPVEVLPQEVLARTPDMLAWWTPAASRTMFFRAKSELADVSGKLFPASGAAVCREPRCFARARPGCELQAKQRHDVGSRTLLEHR